MAHLGYGDPYAQLAAGFGIGIATVFRSVRQAVEVLSAIAPSRAVAMRAIQVKAFVILDGVLLPIEGVTVETPHHSGKRKCCGKNVRIFTDLFGRLLWAPPARLDPRPHRRQAARDGRDPRRCGTQPRRPG